MDSLLPLLPIALLVLACPLGMAALGVGAWLVARARGEKKELSMSCMGGHSDVQQPTAQTDTTRLKDEVARLEQEVEALRAEVKTTGGGILTTNESVAAPSEEERTSAATLKAHPERH